MQAIKMKNLSKTFDTGKTAVNNINFEIKEGEVFGFLGPNGAGKTTTVKLLTGLLTPSTGGCEVCGIDATKEPDKVHKISGMVTEHSQMYDHMSGLENLLFYSALFGEEKDKGKKRALQLLKQLELDDAKDQKLATYSTGMRQRLSLARAMIHHPKVLFLDEPTSGLDPESIISVNNMIKDLAKDEDVTIFLCTHQLRYAQELCTMYGLIDDGEMFASGSLDTLRQQVFKGIHIHIKTDYMPSDISATQVDSMIYSLQIESEKQIPDMVRTIVEHGGNIYEIAIHELSLEEIYFSLLKKERGK